MSTNTDDERRLCDVNRNIRRIFWRFPGDITTAISVMDEDIYVEGRTVLEPYCLEGGEHPKWHSISTEPLMTPPVFKVEVRVDQLVDWTRDWIEQHEQHYFMDGRRLELVEPEGRTEDELFEASDFEAEHEEYEGLPVKLLMCCDEERPPHHEPLTLVSSSPNGLTIHEYITAVHPWLMSKHQDLLGAISQIEQVGEDNALTVDDKFRVDVSRCYDVFVQTKD